MFKLPWIFLCASNLTDFLFGSDATLTFTSTLVAICTEINSRREIVKPSLESLALAPTSRRVVPSWFFLHHCIRKRSHTSTTCIPKSMWLNFLNGFSSVCKSTTYTYLLGKPLLPSKPACLLTLHPIPISPDSPTVQTLSYQSHWTGEASSKGS